MGIDLSDIRATPIEEVAERLGIKVGRNHMALCPFHGDRHPSLYFRARNNRFKCFSCGESGDVIDLVMKYNNVGFREAAEWIAGDGRICSDDGSKAEAQKAEQDGVGTEPAPDIEYLASLVAHPVINGAAERFLYDERRIDPRVVRWCGLTGISVPMPCWRWGKAFYDAPSLLIPYRDVDGSLLSVQGRYLGNGGMPRFRFPRGSHVGMYNKPVIQRLKDGDELWIAEGPSDCWAMLSAGHKAVAIPSATSLTQADIRLLRDGLPDGVSLHMYPDNDEAGMRLFEGLRRWFPQLKGHVLPEGCKDFGEYFISLKNSG